MKSSYDRDSVSMFSTDCYKIARNYLENDLFFQDYIHQAKRTITIVIGSTIAGAILITVVALLVWWFYRRQQQQFVSLNQDILHGGEQKRFIYTLFVISSDDKSIVTLLFKP